MVLTNKYTTNFKVLLGKVKTFKSLWLFSICLLTSTADLGWIVAVLGNFVSASHLAENPKAKMLAILFQTDLKTVKKKAPDQKMFRPKIVANDLKINLASYNFFVFFYRKK